MTFPVTSVSYIGYLFFPGPGSLLVNLLSLYIWDYVQLDMYDEFYEGGAQ